jgi:hypothetical protein
MAGPGCQGIRCGGCGQPLRACACGIAPIKERCLPNQHAFVFVEEHDRNPHVWALFRCERCNVEDFVRRNEEDEE